MLAARQLPQGPLCLNSRVLARWEASMRVSDVIQKCAVFIGETVDGVFQPLATGFFVGYPVGNERATQYLVTAQHCVMQKPSLQIRINTRNGQSEIYDLRSDRWSFHPDERRFVDVAVMPVAISPFLFDVAQISLRKEGLTPEIISQHDIGVGDEVFFPGLFVHHSGQGRNLPIIRVGTIAAMPDEPITTRSGDLNAYLVEARSIGGHSGSPVFVNMEAPRNYSPAKPKASPLAGDDPKPYYLLGLIRGHLRAKDSGEYATADQTAKDLWVNSGIATVIPVQDIWDTLSQPELEEEEERMKALEKERARSVDVPDFIELPASEAKSEGAENPDHREDFTRLVSAASKRKPKGDQT